MVEHPDPKVGDVLEGRVLKHLEWGALIELPGGFVGRLPNGQISWSREKTSSDLVFPVGSSIRVVVRDARRSKAHGKLYIYLSYRDLQPKPIRPPKPKNPLDIAREHFVEGSILEGRIVEFRDYGAIVEIMAGVSGLVHNSEVSWTDKDATASKQFAIGDVIPVKLSYSYSGKPKISLSYRATQPNPWTSVEQDYPMGTRTRARVLKHADFGIFAKLPNGCIGLLHKSRMTGSEMIVQGQEIEVVVVEVDGARQRISLSLA